MLRATISRWSTSNTLPKVVISCFAGASQSQVGFDKTNVWVRLDLAAGRLDHRREVVRRHVRALIREDERRVPHADANGMQKIVQRCLKLSPCHFIKPTFVIRSEIRKPDVDETGVTHASRGRRLDP